ncbi:YidC/Oxa1 family membrane protein insertase [Candidatus Nomurabacteria bacterium]|nr:YidC/Oxa1 family membrane protein insertase [Candidatus Nomurabacteria bacterium]
MIHSLWDTFLYHPLVNALVFLASIIPGGDIGIAIIILTLFVKILIFPLSQRSIESQAKMNILSPELKKIKDMGVNKEEQARLTFELYKKHQTNPFSGCLLVLIQIPVIFALYFVFLKGVNFNPDVIYSFIKAPAQINTMFLGFIDISQKSLALALLAAISQYFQAHFMSKPPVSADDGSFQSSLSRSMHTQMKYFFPVLIFIILYTDWFGVSTSGAVALYWIVSNIFAISQQIYAEKKNKQAPVLS